MVLYMVSGSLYAAAVVCKEALELAVACGVAVVAGSVSTRKSCSADVDRLATYTP